MAQEKVVGFSIDIKGIGTITDTTKLLGLLNTQMILLGNTVSSFNKDSKKTGDVLKDTTTALSKSVKGYNEGQKVVRDLGNGYLEITNSVQLATKEFEDLDKHLKTDIKSTTDLIERNKVLKKVLADAPLEGTEAFEKQKDTISKLTKEFSDNNSAIIKHRKELKNGTKQSEVAAGSIDELKQRLAALTKEYNAATPAGRSFLGVNSALKKEIIATAKSLEAQERAIGKAARGVGFYERAQKGLAKTLLKLSVGRSVADGLANGFRNAASGLMELVKNSDGTNEVFNKLKESGDRLSGTLKVAGTGFLNAFGGTISKIIDNVSFVIFKVSKALTSASKSGGILGSVMSFIGEIFTNFPAILGGVVAVFGEFTDRISKGGLEIQLNFERIFESIKRVGTALTGGDTAEIDKRLASINQKLKNNVVFAKTIGEAYKEGYQNTIKSQEEFNKNVDVEIKQLEEKEAAAKKADEARTKAIEAQKKAVEELKQDRKKQLQDILDDNQARLELVKSLSNQLIEAEAENVQNRTEQQIQQERIGFEQIRQERINNFNKTLDDQVQQEAKTAALFGDSSVELKKLVEENEASFRLVVQLNKKIAEQQEKTHQNKLTEILRAAESERIAIQKAKSDEKAKFFEEETTKIEAELRARLDKEDALLAKQFEKDKEQEKLKADTGKATFSATVDLVNSTISAISSISEAAFAAENAAFDRSINMRVESISMLNKEMENATGLHKKFLERQIQSEEKALDEETKNKEKALIEQAKTQQAISLTQAFIAAALGIANAFSLPPPASFIAAAATGIATGVQIGVIASKTFEDGGILEGNSHSQGGIKTPFGELEGGEVVINKVSSLKYRAELSAINVAGGGRSFALGGVLGAPISAPTLNSAAQADEKFNMFLELSLAQTKATNSRIDRLSVILNLNTVNQMQSTDSTLNALTTL